MARKKKKNRRPQRKQTPQRQPPTPARTGASAPSRLSRGVIATIVAGALVTATLVYLLMPRSGTGHEGASAFRLSETEVQASHGQMVELLRQIAESSDPQSNPYLLNDERAAMFRSRLQNVPESNLAERLTLRLSIAHELVRAGRTQEAIAELNALDQAISLKSIE